MTVGRRIGEETLLDFPLNVGQISYTFRWDVLDLSLDTVGELKVTSGAQIRVTPAANITRQCTGVGVLTEDLDNLNLYRVRLRPMMVMEDGTEESLGVFLPQARADSLMSGREITSMVLFDQDAVIDDDMESSVGVPSNGSLTDAMIMLLEQADIEDYEIAPGGSAADPIIWPAGTPRKAILDQLAAMKGCLPPYFDRDGRYTCRRLPNFQGDDFDHQYSIQNSRILRDTISKGINLEIPNVHQVINTGPTNHPIVGSAQVARGLPFSVGNRGRRVVKTWRIQGVNSTADAVEVAKMKAATAGLGYAELTFGTHIDPRHDVWDVVLFGDKLYIETGWSSVIAVGASMTHSITNADATEDD